MSIEMDRNTLNRLNRDIGDLRSKEADEVRKEAKATRKVNRALENARKASSASTTSMYTCEADRESKNIESAQARRSQHSKKIATKTKETSRLQEKINQNEERERKQQLADDATRQKNYERQQRVYDQRIRDLEAQLAERNVLRALVHPRIAEGEKEVFDFFISHASEDKKELVADLAEKARLEGLKVWYDAFTLECGDSLRQKIDKGLAGASFGVVVLSTNFFAKRWPAYELDGLVQKEMLGTGRILPIWHKVTLDEVAKHSPSLAGRLALNTSVDSTDTIVKELIKT